jgi:hypothetical protein
MSRGGARPGAGRKKGDLQKRTREVAEKVAASGEMMPLEVMLEVMRKARDAEDDVMALDAAKAAAPYIHPRLAAVEHSGADGGPIQIQRVERVIVDPKADDDEDSDS